MKIYRATISNRLTQNFGANNACAKMSPAGFAYRPYQITSKPATAKSCPMYYTEFYPLLGMFGHNGNDWAIFRGEAIYFNVDIPNIRWYAERDTDDDQGIGIRVKSLDPIKFEESDLPAEMSDHSKRYWKEHNGMMYIQMLYWHIKESALAGKPQIQVGTFADGKPQMRAEVKLGDLIAFGNSTGASSGDHVHEAMKFCEASGFTIGNDNGYYGAVDHSKWDEQQTFVGQVIKVKEQAMTAIKLAHEVIAIVRAFIRIKFGRRL